MSIINPLAREISAKIVFYGPGLSGKTTTLKFIHASVKPQRRGELVTLATEGDRTIFFDFLPLQIKDVRGMGVRFQLYTVPGQVFYEATRRLVLQGADGVVFVADSQPAAREANLESLADLRRNLEDEAIDVERFPIAIQYNKRDLPGVMPVDVMKTELNWVGAPDFETCATSGDGVLETLKEVSRMVIRSLWKQLPEPPLPVVKSKPPSEGIEKELTRVAELNRTGEFLLDAEDSTSEREIVPEGAISFASLWEGGDAATVVRVENAIRRGAHGEALTHAVRAMVDLLDSLPGTSETASSMSKAALLGLDGREFLRFCRLASLHADAVTAHDALFALYMLVAARVKAGLIG